MALARRPERARSLASLGGLLCMAAVAAVRAAEPGAIRFQPENERPLANLVVGIGVEGVPYFMLPPPRPCSDPSVAEEIAAELYGLDIELSHGALFRRLPARTHLYVAVPAASGGASGKAKQYFRRYLVSRCGWSAADADRRVHTFEVPAPIVFAQDSGRVLGYDASGRLVVATGVQDQPAYRGFVAALVSGYPERFASFDLGPSLSAEGGDQEIVALPQGGVGALLGYRRVLRYHGILSPEAVRTARLGNARIEEAVTAYSRALSGLPVQVLPRAPLQNPTLTNPDVYHLDMKVCVLSQADRVDAFVPTYREGPVDRMTGLALPEGFVAQVQALFDLSAGELSTRGYVVTRLPFRDHPARTPVNVCKYRDPATHRTVVMLAKYPDHISEGRNPQRSLNTLLERFRREFAAAPSCEAARALVQDAWKQLLAVEELPNPYFDIRKKIVEERGYTVVEVPMFAWGGGSLHCLTMH